MGSFLPPPPSLTAHATPTTPSRPSAIPPLLTHRPLPSSTVHRVPLPFLPVETLHFRDLPHICRTRRTNHLQRARKTISVKAFRVPPDDLELPPSFSPLSRSSLASLGPDRARARVRARPTLSRLRRDKRLWGSVQARAAARG